MNAIRVAKIDHARNDVTTPTELVVNLTLRCPLSCSHCCFSSDMFQEGHLPIADAVLAIGQATGVPSIGMVHFVGGDPFLHTDIMAGAIREARRRGLRAGATTSAFWAKTPERARAVLAPLVEAGLGELTISYDDAHAQFVRLSSIAAAVDAALEAGLALRIAVVIGPQASLTAAVLRDRLNLADRPDVNIYETGINSTGRAAETGRDAGAEPARQDPEHQDPEHQDGGHQDHAYRGPCKSVLRNITVNRDGNILPCCGVLPHYESLQVGNIHAGGVAEAVASACADPLFRWIAFEGPVAILEDVTAADAVPKRPEDFDGICTACDVIFHEPVMLERVRAHTAKRLDRIALFEEIYRAAGLFRPFAIAPVPPVDTVAP